MGKNSKVIMGVSGAVLVVLLLVATMTGGGVGRAGTMMGGTFGGVGTMMGGGMLGGGFGGMLLMLLFWALVIAFLVTLITWGLNQSQRR